MSRRDNSGSIKHAFSYGWIPWPVIQQDRAKERTFPFVVLQTRCNVKEYWAGYTEAEHLTFDAYRAKGFRTVKEASDEIAEHACLKNFQIAKRF